MSGKISEVSAFEAKTHLSKLLRDTELGKSFVICRRGKAVARLVPFKDKGASPDFGKLSASFREIRKNVSGKVKVRELVESGRRF